MPTVLSKIKDTVYGRVWSFPYNCYEVGHGWTPYCTGAAFDVGVSAFQNSLPLYTSLYLFTQLGLQRKYNFEAFYETIKSITTSASFLGFNFFAGIGVSCLLRNNSDRYYYRVQCFLPGFIASYMALLIERPSRRPALAFYMANLSSELLYKWASSRGYVKSLPHGETLLFALGMACWLHFVRTHGFGHDPVSTAMKYLIGPLEAKSRSRKKLSIEASDPTTDKLDLQQVEKKKSPVKFSFLKALEQSVTELLNSVFDCYHVCPHKGVSCVDYCLTPALTRFMMGYLGRSLLNIGGNYRMLMSNPGKALALSFKSRAAVKFGLFLGTFVGASKTTHCLLRRIYGEQKAWHSAAAGGLAGFSMLFAPRSTLSTYIFWKCLEQYFFLAVQRGQIKRANEVICLVYAVSVNVLLYIFALEPRFIRPSYMKFIDKISDHKLHQVNRMVLDVFGTGASIGYEDWFPNLEPKYLSREFHELVFNWLIQPH